MKTIDNPFIEEIRVAIISGVTTVRRVIDELNANGYHTIADIPADKRRKFYEKVIG